MPEPNSGCWIWTGSLDFYGYARLSAGVRGHRRIHVENYEAIIGAVPEGLELDHKCRVRCCVNPDHLEAVTHAENVRRGEAGKVSGARLRAMTHCKRGHELAGENIQITKVGSRRCRVCRRKGARDVD